MVAQSFVRLRQLIVGYPEVRTQRAALACMFNRPRVVVRRERQLRRKCVMGWPEGVESPENAAWRIVPRCRINAESTTPRMRWACRRWSPTRQPCGRRPPQPASPSSQKWTRPMDGASRRDRGEPHGVVRRLTRPRRYSSGGVSVDGARRVCHGEPAHASAKSGSDRSRASTAPRRAVSWVVRADSKIAAAQVQIVAFLTCFDCRCSNLRASG